MTVLMEYSHLSLKPDTIPQWIGMTELVACVKTDQVILQTCGPYYYTVSRKRAPDLQRIRQDRIVQVYKAQTVVLVDSKTFKGAVPRYCQNQEQIPGNWDSSKPYPILGDPVSDDEIYNWLEPMTSTP
jgi:hypothetical protein